MAQCTGWYHYTPVQALLLIRWYELYIISIERFREDDSNDMHNLYQRMSTAEVMIVQRSKPKYMKKLSIFHLAQSFGRRAYT